MDYEMIPRYRPDSTNFFFHRRIYSLWPKVLAYLFVLLLLFSVRLGAVVVVVAVKPQDRGHLPPAPAPGTALPSPPGGGGMPEICQHRMRITLNDDVTGERLSSDSVTNSLSPTSTTHRVPARGLSTTHESQLNRQYPYYFCVWMRSKY
jgi:hypothetical protein